MTGVGGDGAAEALVDVLDGRRAASATGLLADFGAAGVLSAADIHVAHRLAALCEEADEQVMLAAALAVRAPRAAHVYVDLETIRERVVVEQNETDPDPATVDLDALPWPEPAEWIASVGASAMVAVDTSRERLPLRLEGSHLYLDRYWREECQVAEDLLALARPAEVAPEDIVEPIGRLFPGATDQRQAMAAATAYLRHLTVVAGGPGTGKTTTVARILALLLTQAAESGGREPMIALAAPAGKAAARLTEAVHYEAGELDADAAVRDRLSSLEATTLHRLLGWRPDSQSRFAHNRGQRLPHDVVIVDETSMVSLSLMARLVEAVRPEARLVLVGDPDQLASVEAGAVLGDIVGEATPENLLLGGDALFRLSRGLGGDLMLNTAPGNPIGDGVIVLDESHRYGSGIGRLAEAIRRGEPSEVAELLAEDHDEVTWLDIDLESATGADLAPLRRALVPSGRRMIEAALAGDGQGALNALSKAKLLCAHRQGPYGASTWDTRLEAWLAEEVAGFVPRGRWYVGRPVMITGNDYELRLFNGDLGVIIASPKGPLACFAKSTRHGAPITIAPERLGPHETVHAMTIHKAQGSQFESVAVVVPPASSRIATRQLLYTSVTRAQKRILLSGSADAVRAAVRQPVDRASGLRRRLWTQIEVEG